MAVKLIIFDFDGTLIELREAHYQALNQALSTIDPKFVISQEDHISIYDGLSTRKKLNLLVSTKNFPSDKIEQVFEQKQIHTLKYINDQIIPSQDLINTLQTLKTLGYQLYIASNAIRDTIIAGLNKLQITHFFDHILSNEDVKNQKPHSQIYLQAMVQAGVNPDETLIVEDAKHGREAGMKSGAYVCGVDNAADLSLTKIQNRINQISPKKVKWAGKDVNILIPMAGAGSRFFQQGYKLPKPLIDVNNKTMIERVVENLNIDGNFIFVVQEQHYDQYNLGILLPLIAPNCQIIKTNGLTEGAACTALLAKEYINNSNHLLIANSDQYLNFDSCDFFYNAISKDADGSIISFHKENDLKWSYIKLQNDQVCQVAEKQQISNLATVGLYYWKRGHDFVNCAERMIANNERFNNEFYIAPTYNYAIQDHKKIISYQIKPEDFHGLGTPEDLEKFLAGKIV